MVSDKFIYKVSPTHIKTRINTNTMYTHLTHIQNKYIYIYKNRKKSQTNISYNVTTR